MSKSKWAVFFTDDYDPDGCDGSETIVSETSIEDAVESFVEQASWEFDAGDSCNVTVMTQDDWHKLNEYWHGLDMGQKEEFPDINVENFSVSIESYLTFSASKTH